MLQRASVRVLGGAAGTAGPPPGARQAHPAARQQVRRGHRAGGSRDRNTRPSLVHVMVILVSDWTGRGGGGVAAGYRGAGELRPVPHQGGVQRGHQEPGAQGGIQGELGLVDCGSRDH